MRRVAAAVTGRRSKWLVVAAWIVAIAVLSPLAAKLPDVTRDDTESFLPAGAESTEVQRLLASRFPGGETSSGLVVYRRAGGLTDADKARIERDGRALARALPLAGRQIVVPFQSGEPVAGAGVS